MGVLYLLMHPNQLRSIIQWYEYLLARTVIQPN